MDNVDHILSGIPLFRHCTGNEISMLRRKGRPVSIPKGQKMDLRRAGFLYVVLRGLFELEALGKNDLVYLAPGSLFGDIPFTMNKHRGSVKALMASELLLLDIDEIYRFFLASFKAMRGYLKAISKMGFELSDVGKKYAGNKSRVITVYGGQTGSGKTLFASCLGLACAAQGKTIILDMSYTGNSVFTIFDRKITHAISQRDEEELSSERFIFERIAAVNENLALLNIAFGSKVRVDPGIIAPVLFVLSKEYRFIIIDISHQDEALRDCVMGLTDVFFAILKRSKEREALYDLCDNGLREGQRMLYVLNRHFEKDARSFEGGFLFDRLETENDEDVLPALKERAGAEEMRALADQFISQRRRALVCSGGMMEAIAYAGLLRALHKAGAHMGLYYASSLSYVVVAFYMLFSDDDELDQQLARLFSEERINSLLDITFPERHVISNQKILKFAREITRNRRIEFFRNVPAAMLAGEEGLDTRIFSTGYLHDLITGSFLLHPVFEAVGIAGGLYHSGYPRAQARPENLLRTDVDEIIHASVYNRQRLRFSGKRVLRFYEKYLDYLYYWRPDDHPGEAADKHLYMEIDEGELKVKKIVEVSEGISNKLLKENRI